MSVNPPHFHDDPPPEAAMPSLAEVSVVVSGVTPDGTRLTIDVPLLEVNEDPDHRGYGVHLSMTNRDDIDPEIVQDPSGRDRVMHLVKQPEYELKVHGKLVETGEPSKLYDLFVSPPFPEEKLPLNLVPAAAVDAAVEVLNDEWYQLLHGGLTHAEVVSRMMVAARAAGLR